MRQLLLIGASLEENREAVGILEAQGFNLFALGESQSLDSLPLEERPDLVLLDLTYMPQEEARGYVQRCRVLSVPTIALVPRGRVADMDFTIEFNDFITLPVDPEELMARARHVQWRVTGVDSRDLIRVGDMVIDTSRYEVTVGSNGVLLTFKEYELLRELATQRGKVRTREVLLNRVWGYNYFGGTRTVDVHVRRLRSKIEDADHTFIETIRNVGYRFKELP